MPTTIKLKNGSGAPLAGDLVQGEPALDLTNKRLYTEDSGGNVIEVGTNPSTIDINAGSIDGVTIGASSAPTVTNIDINGGTIDGVTIGGASAGAITATTITGSGDMNIDSGTLFVDVSENRVGVGTTSPTAELDILGGIRLNKNGNLSTAKVGNFGVTNFEGYISPYNENGKTEIHNTTSAGYIAFFTSTSDTEAARFNTSGNLAFPNGQGIDFSSSIGGGVTSAVLDDYEEGTWTPTSTQSGTVSSGICKYTKIGRVVHLTFDLTGFSDTSSSNFVSIGGIPFTGIENATYFVGAVYGERVDSEFLHMVPYIDGGSEEIRFTTGVGTTGFGSTLLHNDINDGSDVEIRGSITYML